jgi:hypothetical protein
MNFMDKNLVLLKENHPQLFQMVTSLSLISKRLEILETKSSDNTVRVSVKEYGRQKRLFIHSSFNPMIEGHRFALENMGEQKKVNLLYGFGLGYHVLYMVELLKPGNRLIVFDLNLDIFYQALKLNNLSDILACKDIKLFISDNINYISSNLARVIENSEDLNIITHVPSLTATDERYDELKYILQEVNLRKSVSLEYRDLLQTNFHRNRQNIKHNIGAFFEKFKDIPIIIVCAGPSLDKNKHLLKGLEDRALIICVGHALKSLLKINVKPHFIITIDPAPIVYKQIEGLEDLDIPFILMATAAPENGEKYRGPKFMACQHPNYLKSEESGFLIKTGGSVSTAALDIAIRMAGNPIIFIGQDLAYSSDKHHCEDSFRENVSIKPLDTMRKVKGWGNEDIPTNLGMVSFNRWIQNRIRDERGITFINATEGGAFIDGLMHMPFAEVIKHYLTKPHNIKQKLDEILSAVLKPQ